jgi:hypothetical protein
MTTLNLTRNAGILDSKSKIAELQRSIDKLVREFYSTGDSDCMVRVAQLARQKEQLLKPATMRSAEFQKVS